MTIELHNYTCTAERFGSIFSYTYLKLLSSYVAAVEVCVCGESQMGAWHVGVVTSHIRDRVVHLLLQRRTKTEEGRVERESR